MTLSTKRNPVRRRFARELERSLDGMQATRAERIAARSTFKNMIGSSPPARMSVAVVSSIRAAERVRQGSAQPLGDTPAKSA